MASLQLPDPDSEFGVRVARRLRDEPIAWLTHVDGAGTPQPAPVWFLWDDASGAALVYSHGEARRLDHLAANPRVALHLDGDGRGGDIVVLTGEAERAPDEPPVHENRRTSPSTASGSPRVGGRRRSSHRSIRCHCASGCAGSGVTEPSGLQSRERTRRSTRAAASTSKSRSRCTTVAPVRTATAAIRQSSNFRTVPPVARTARYATAAAW